MNPDPTSPPPPPLTRQYLFAVLVVVGATGLCFAAFPFFDLVNLIMIYLVGVLLVAARGRRGPAVAASVLSVAAMDFCFVPPRFHLTVSDAQYLWTFLVMLATALVISHLTLRLRYEAEAARQGQRRTALTHAFTQQLTSARGIEKVLSAAARHVAEVFNAGATLYLPGADGRLEAKARAGEAPASVDKERGVAQWVYDRWNAAGLGTAALPGEEALFLPLQGDEGTVGVLRVQPRSRDWLLAPEQRLLLDSFVHQIASALAIVRLEDHNRKVEVEAAAERLRSSLLSAVSHDLRTPLAAILGSAEALLAKSDNPPGSAARDLLENIRSEAERLTRLIQNLLEVTRLESGAVVLQKELHPLEDVVGGALARLEKALIARRVTVDLPPDFPPVPMDGLLMEQVFVNLIENALRHTPPQSPIDIAARSTEKNVTVTVADRGPGLDPGDRERVFEKFYRGKASPGAGLGLAICRAVAEAHGGRLTADRRPGGGAVFELTLPRGDDRGR